jgi:hypothetical protein
MAGEGISVCCSGYFFTLDKSNSIRFLYICAINYPSISSMENHLTLINRMASNCLKILFP